MMLLGQTKDVKCLWTFGKFSPPVPKPGKSFKQLVSYKYEWCLQPSWTTNAIHDEVISNIWEHIFIYIYIRIDLNGGWSQTGLNSKLYIQPYETTKPKWSRVVSELAAGKNSLVEFWWILQVCGVCWDTVAKARGTWSYTMMAPGHAEMDLNVTSAPLEKVKNDPALLG